MAPFPLGPSRRRWTTRTTPAGRAAVSGREAAEGEQRMPKPFDASTKHLLETRPGDWLEYLGLPRAPVEVTDADLSTVTAAADKVLRVLGPSPWLVHVELQ